MCNLHSNGGNISNQSPSLLSPKSSVSSQSSSQVFSIECRHSTTTVSFLSCLLLPLLKPVQEVNLLAAPNIHSHFPTPVHLLTFFPPVGTYFISTPLPTFFFSFLWSSSETITSEKPCLTSLKGCLSFSPVFPLSYCILPYITFFHIYDICVSIHSL